MIYEHELIKDDFQLQLRFDIINTICDYSAPHWHNHLEILFILDGSMSVYINDRTYELGWHDIIVINPREIHSTQIHGSIRYILLQIPLSDLKRLLPNFEMLYFEEFLPCNASKRKTTPKTETLLLAMENEFAKKEDGYQMLFTAYIHELLYDLYRHHVVKLDIHNKNKAARNLLRIETIMDYVKANYQNTITLDEISGSLSISPEYFCRLFKKYTNQTFLEYVNTVRLIHLHNDLLHSNDSINYLMEKNGITNYKVFIRMFRHAYGSTPLKIRNSAKAG